jgi:hypothetical protein
MTTKLQRYLESINACNEAREWVGNRGVKEAWAKCPRSDWMLWLLARSGVDCSEIGFWCAERARQSALKALPAGAAKNRLAACAPIVDRATALSAQDAARAANAARAAYANDGDKAKRKEHRAMCNHIRKMIKRPVLGGKHAKR